MATYWILRRHGCSSYTSCENQLQRMADDFVSCHDSGSPSVAAFGLLQFTTEDHEVLTAVYSKVRAPIYSRHVQHVRGDRRTHDDPSRAHVERMRIPPPDEISYSRRELRRKVHPNPTNCNVRASFLKLTPWGFKVIIRALRHNPAGIPPSTVSTNVNVTFGHRGVAVSGMFRRVSCEPWGKEEVDHKPAPLQAWRRAGYKVVPPKYYPNMTSQPASTADKNTTGYLKSIAKAYTRTSMIHRKRMKNSGFVVVAVMCMYVSPQMNAESHVLEMRK
ncbi:hypothetical protein G7K_2044-t1 [Saitoella complicata NRRL Y-17804]|uniref:Uncharacterized protein n=1 Tax=Saitoella complicata (strain BCRC 22490 / CBS 7301 / JCM 7358 / NBRC 10748 / NRRL Y-17804) TaxID=698492 RepID=A0A0E9NDF0_SAICN|nr:hypothetical protein G7K_2044-t1 [Saitoella complicata NRRL Y-17804]